MTVIVLTGCKSSLRGDLTKWLLEIDTGVYIGNISARIRDELWKKISDNISNGRALMLFNARNVQGYAFKLLNAKRIPTDFDGLNLILVPLSEEMLSESSAPHLRKKVIQLRPQLQDKWESYVVMDSETTGLDRANDRMIELGAVRINDGRIVDHFQRLIRVNKALPPEIVALTSISDETLVQEGVPEAQALTEFRVFTKDLPLISHNISFDIAFLNNACQRNGMPAFTNLQADTIKLAKKKIKGVVNYSLGTLLQHLNIPMTPCHRALQDSLATYELLIKLNEIE